MRKGLVILAGVAASLIPLATARAETPTPEPNFAAPVVPGRGCVPQAGNPYERDVYKQEGWAKPTYARYPGVCQRLKFTFGPIVVKPGQNDVLIQPVTIEKPAQDGFITRIRPDLVDENGNVPPIEQVHLHHGTWLSEPNYGTGPFFASGEEKTIAPFPRGYGMPIHATDQWQLLYMVHSAVPQAKLVWITYDVDFVPAVAAKRLGLRPAYPVWLDVRPGAYPVFNVQRGFGSGKACTWPRQACAFLDPWGRQTVGQGMPGSGTGTDWRFPSRGGTLGAVNNFQGGTLIGIGGHLHPGGISNDIDLVRGGKARRIYTGVAQYWDHKDHTKVGGPPTSWDYSMAITGLPRWGVHVKPGDILRSNATYDTTIQSTYENMGIAVTFIAPDLPNGKPTARGIDAFKAPFDASANCRSGGLANGVLCDKGVVTHGHMPEAGNYGNAAGTLTSKRAGAITQVDIAAFTYLQGDLTRVDSTGIPTVKLGQNLQFVNVDAAADIYHTITSCAFPCTGPTGVAFPVADGRSSLGRQIDFDSAELGFGPPIGPAKNAADWTIPITPQNGFRAGSVLTYYCRIHPFMRGAVAVQG